MKFFSPQVVMQRLSLRVLRGNPSTGSGQAPYKGSREAPSIGLGRRKSYIDLIDSGIEVRPDI